VLLIDVLTGLGGASQEDQQPAFYFMIRFDWAVVSNDHRLIFWFESIRAARTE
jgi:hypothetical protein